MHIEVKLSGSSGERLLAGIPHPPLDSLLRFVTSHGRGKIDEWNAHVSFNELSSTYTITFPGYLAELPEHLRDDSIEILQVALKRRMQLKTRAKPGYYMMLLSGITATVEAYYVNKTVPNPKGEKHPFLAHDITVTGPSLASVNAYNSELSSGECDQDIVRHFA